MMPSKSNDDGPHHPTDDGLRHQQDDGLLDDIYIRYYTRLPYRLALQLMQSNCHLCQAPPDKRYTSRRKTSTLYTEITQDDPTRPLDQWNHLAACQTCIRSKGTMSTKDYIEHCKKVAKCTTLKS